ncbi:stage V sporulation protein B [Anoxybacillus gonensis]|uniref:Stage V sporulation protein B n=1 Tax=Anoxybacillus gonensis TaxID=198467 RepID=A0AAW7TGZ6_9BACL|nr:stage V sporulation protein B [Anoxybacillus gonensis]AKS39051.1 stage V sporulation protein B [Anoxybacillus gonensis]KGP59875.1 stage V sporulation protein B [Anoxybacillus gonensis]MDO0878474.1 stage V sporulation protein B [Anoxybacillus gonensis]
MSKFLKGTMILIVAGLLTRILGFINRIVVARLIGEEGVGLYMMAVPTLVLAITITQFGLPVAISKLVAEAEAVGDKRKVKKILVVSLSITTILSFIFFPALLAIAPILSKTLFTDARVYYPLVAIAPVVPIVALSSVLRGYFQGRQQMKPYAYSQLLEQAVRITLIAAFTTAFLPYGIEYAAAGAMISAVVGEFVSLIYLFITFKQKKPIRIRYRFFAYVKQGKDTFISLMRIAVPTLGSRMIGSIAWFFEPIVVAQSLALAGITATHATKQYGELTGYALPLLMLPSFITYALATSLVPAISEAAAQKQHRLIEYRLHQAVRLSLFAGGLSIVVLYVLAEEMMYLMYGANQAAIFVKVMAPFFIFYYLQGPLQAVLQALDLAKEAMTNSLIGAVVKTALIFWLASQPSLGIMGAALAITVGIMIVTLLHAATIVKAISLTLYVKQYVAHFVVIVSVAAIGHMLVPILPFSLLVKTIVVIVIMTFIYLVLAQSFRLIEKDEFRQLFR